MVAQGTGRSAAIEQELPAADLDQMHRTTDGPGGTPESNDRPGAAAWRGHIHTRIVRRQGKMEESQ